MAYAQLPKKTAIEQLLNLLIVGPFGTHEMGPGLNSTS